MNKREQMKASVLTKKQVKEFRGEWTDKNGGHVVIATVRHDDQCGNGYNTFSITGSVYGEKGSRRDGVVLMSNGKSLSWECGGCVHDVIFEHIPELREYIKWHLVSTDGPMHYVANTVYHAGDRDCHGLRKGEFKQFVDKKTGLKSWILEDEAAQKHVDSMECPESITLKYVPWGRMGEGKKRDLDAARTCAVWPDATDEELSQEPEALKAALLARLPGLMVEFQKAVESLGFVY